MAAVSLSGVSFGYSAKSTLTDIDAEIEYGEIYSLLGPSGAGKTTLLRLVLGLLRPSSGRISVFGHAPGKYNRLIGYMPQDMALCATFTVGQTLHYFASIYRLSHAQLEARKKDLTSFLNLPHDEARVSELSGGQQKLLSLCLAFVHHPRLLILDEPTVGSDPLVGDCIWNYLRQCCRQNTSIVIVTHYIEEACFGHRVGMLRDGRMLEQDTPGNLIAKYRQNSLEDVFVYICVHGQVAQPQEERPQVTKIKYLEPRDEDEPNKLDFQSKNLLSNYLLQFWILMTFFRKNLFQFYTIPSLIMFLVPAFQVILFTSSFSRDTIPIPTAVYNADEGARYSGWLMNSTVKMDAYHVVASQYDSLDGAVSAVEEGKAIGAIWFSGNFSDSFEARLVDPESVETVDTTSEVKLFIDNSRTWHAMTLTEIMRQAVFDLMEHVNVENELQPMGSPFDRTEIYGKDSKFSDYFLPGSVLATQYFFLLVMFSQLLLKEMHDGLFERSLIAGVSHNVVFVSNFLVCIVVAIAQVAFMLLALASAFFDVYNLASYRLLFVMFTSQSINAIASALFISSICRVPIDAFVLSFFVGFFQIFCSGVIFDSQLNVYPLLGEFLLRVCPLGIPSQSLRNAMHRGWDLTHPQVYNGILLNLITALLQAVITAILFRRNSKFKS